MAASEKKRRWWRRCRRAFRGFRICTLLLILILVAVGGWLNYFGLPHFIKQPLLNRLHAQGLDVEISRVRLRWYRGIVAEDVRFGRAGEEAMGPQFMAREVEVRLNHSALMKFHLQVDALVLHNGRFIWPVTDTNALPEDLSATNIQAQLRFLPGDRWELDPFTAAVAGVNLQLFLTVTNASTVRDWKVFHPTPGAPPAMTEHHLRDLARTLGRLKFPLPPKLSVSLHGDAKDPQSFHGVLTLDATGAETPWGNLTNSAFIARLIAAGTNAGPQADVQLRAEEAVTGPDTAKNFLLHLHVNAGDHMTNPMQASVEASADAFITEWAQTTGVRLSANWAQSPTNSIPVSGLVNLHLGGTRTRWGSAGGLDATAQLHAPVEGGPRNSDASWGWWAGLEPYLLDWNCKLNDVQASDARVGVFAFKELACGGQWRAPELTLTNAHAELYRGRFDAKASLNVASRELTFSGMSDFDAKKTLPLLTEGGREWLEQYDWTNPPLAHASGSMTMPPWTNADPDWRHEVLPTLVLLGDVKVGEAAFRDVPVSNASLHFGYSNMIWTIPDLVAERPEGILNLSTESDDRSKRFHFRVHSTFDPVAARHLLPPEGQHGLDLFVLTQPPVIDAELWGQWHDPDQIGATATVTLTNFSLRGETATYLHGNIQYTNQFIIVTDARAEREGGQYITASGIGVDPAARKAYLTNGEGSMESGPFFRVIGPKVSEVMEPYHFSKPPVVHAYGTIPLSEDPDADLHFTVDGGPFNWLWFHTDHISGGVDWVGKHLTLTNVHGAFYGGQMDAAAAFDFSPREGADYSFGLEVMNTDLHALMADVYTGTNHLEGQLTGVLNITSATTTDIHSWNGNGAVDLRNGLIWDIPIFGIFSPILDKIQKGWGESRADQGSAAFTITNSVIRSDNLNFRAPAVEMEYQGTVDFDGKVDAIVRARLLRQVPLLGPVVGLALEPFEYLFAYKVTGTLSEPKSEPQHDVTKVLLSPFQIIRQIMPGETPRGTNSPPSVKQ